MKRMIEISEEDFNKIRKEGFSVSNGMLVISAIVNSTPLNECKAEDCISRKLAENVFTKAKMIGDTRSAKEIFAELPSVYPKSDKSVLEDIKAEIIHSIAKQYSDHNEVVPVWLSIGDISGKEQE